MNNRLFALIGLIFPILCQASDDYVLSQNLLNNYHPVYSLLSFNNAVVIYPDDTLTLLHQVHVLLMQQTPALSKPLIDETMATLRCAGQHVLYPNDKLVVIDYTQPSNQKRLWVIDLTTKKLLFHTYVAHGIKSGELFSNYFSNKYNSRASSIGVYQTKQAYYGREGLSLRLQGLDRYFNDNALNRAIVMHPAWYAEEHFIKKYGRAGRSWGCPALPSSNASAIINTIKDHALFVIYAKDDAWFLTSKFLNCQQPNRKQAYYLNPKPVLTRNNDAHDAILFVDLNHNNKHDDTEPVMVIAADDYQQLFKSTIPLKRMIRRQINGHVYIALTLAEAQQMSTLPAIKLNHLLHFAKPILTFHHGYAATEMKLTDYNTINSLSAATGLPVVMLKLQNKTLIQLKSTDQFIRWVGL